MESSYHTPVLVDAVSQFLPTKPAGVYVDGTMGGGGHAEAILMNCSAGAVLIGFDMDIEALNVARQRLERFGNQVRTVHENFSRLASTLVKLGISHIDGLLLDLGVSSHQIDHPARGFSFQAEARLDMRMDQQQARSGWDIINTYDEKQLADLLWNYGEEIHSRRIARKIVESRKQKPIETTAELVAVISSVAGGRFLQKTLARIFQAIRIEVNNELENLRQALRDGLELMNPGGRMVVIAYHSLEDRIVKDFFKAEARSTIPSAHKLIPDQTRAPKLKVLTRKPMMAGDTELARNPRARSAKMRVAERI